MSTADLKNTVLGRRDGSGSLRATEIATTRAPASEANLDHSGAEAAPRAVFSWSAIPALLALAMLLILGHLHAWKWLVQVWLTDDDYSHGLLVPVFAAILIWLRRDIGRDEVDQGAVWPILCGLGLISLGAVVTWVGIYCHIITLEAVAIIPSFAGVVLCCGGWRGARIAWPAVLFLVFMIPLPRIMGILLADNLQYIATRCSTYLMQALGMPAVSEGSIIYLSNSALGVAEACSGIRMLMSFFAIATAVCLLSKRSLWEKGVIWLSAPMIAVVVNVLRITAVGVAHEFGNQQLANQILHDFAGWLMMPMGLSLMGVEFFLLGRVFPAATLEAHDLPLPVRSRRQESSQQTPVVS